VRQGKLGGGQIQIVSTTQQAERREQCGNVGPITKVTRSRMSNTEDKPCTRYPQHTRGQIITHEAEERRKGYYLFATYSNRESEQKGKKDSINITRSCMTK
jgi:hypothetical protein